MRALAHTLRRRRCFRPVNNPQSRHTSKFIGVIGHQRDVKRQRVGSDQRVKWSNSFALCFERCANATKPPADAIGNRFASEDALTKAGIARAVTTDANNKIYMAKANQLFNVEDDAAKIKAKFLFIPAQSDLVVPPEMSQQAAAKLRGLGKSADVFVIEGDGGHLDGVLAIAKASEVIRAFLAK